MDMKKTWYNMINRCKASSPSRRYYYDKGISVCREWMDFDTFIKDMGDRPSPEHSIDRIDGSKGYSKDNCRWATHKEQARNTASNHLVVFDGEQMTVSEVAEILGEKQNTVLCRIRRGWTMQEIRDGMRIKPTKSIIKQNIDKIQELREEGKTTTEIGKMFGVDGSNISRELVRRGVNVNSQSLLAKARASRAKRLSDTGLTNKEIATKMNLSQSTISNYLTKSAEERTIRNQHKEKK